MREIGLYCPRMFKPGLLVKFSKFLGGLDLDLIRVAIDALCATIRNLLFSNRVAA